MDPITINRIAKIRQDEILAAQARDRQYNPNRKSLFSRIAGFLQSTTQAPQPRTDARRESPAGSDPCRTMEHSQVSP
ncbi:MAG: hypothetical protein DIU68_004840 [Chloroflexota bacterium]|nr:MAG: hypothetical protein DIU68_07780 [Chloroflexota bacterium]